MKKLSLITTAACVAMFTYAGVTSSFVHSEEVYSNAGFEQDTIKTPRDTSRVPRIPVPSEPEPTPLPRPDNPTPIPDPTPVPPNDPAPNPVPSPTDPAPVPNDPNPMLDNN